MLSRLLALLLGLGCGFSAQAQWPALERLKAERGARVSAALYDLDQDRWISGLDRQQRLSPASLTKLVIAAEALATWPGDHRFTTRLQAALPDAQGTVESDLWIVSDGDPSLEHRDLWLLAARLKQRGVQRILGDVVGSLAPFGALGCETKDRCDALARTHTAYDAQISALGIDFGNWCIDLLPQTPGEPVAIRHCAALEIPLPRRGELVSRSPGRATSMWLDRRTPASGEELIMGGELVRETRLYRSMSNPALGAALMLKQALAELGIDVFGQVRLSEATAPASLPVLARVEGAPVREQVAGLLRYSNNFISDVLTLGVAASRTPQPVTTLAEASRWLERRIEAARKRMGLREPANAPVPLLLNSGSGLTPENRLSAEDLVALLREVYHQPQHFPLFYAGLVVPGEAPSAFLRRGSPAWRERVALKTGTLSVPVTVFGTAGYLRKPEGGWMAYAIIVNGQPHRGVPLALSLEAMREDLEPWISGTPRRGR